MHAGFDRYPSAALAVVTCDAVAGRHRAVHDMAADAGIRRQFQNLRVGHELGNGRASRSVDLHALFARCGRSGQEAGDQLLILIMKRDRDPELGRQQEDFEHLSRAEPREPDRMIFISRELDRQRARGDERTQHVVVAILARGDIEADVDGRIAVYGFDLLLE